MIFRDSKEEDGTFEILTKDGTWVHECYPDFLYGFYLEGDT